MSVTNPERIVTKQDLADFYEGIFPYLGGNAEAGFTPIGTIIAVMGNSAPTNYLACNGQIVNIADYPELANYFKAQFGSYNYFGGNGTTTFAICDLRGEFLRGTGTNSHTNQGNGASVGTHQDGTTVYALNSDSSNTYITSTSNFVSGIGNADAVQNTGTSSRWVRQLTVRSTDSQPSAANNPYTSRPTNTSVLYCIATKNIYLNPSNDYSTDEKVVGTWLDGKTIWQKTFITTFGEINVAKEIELDISAETIVSMDGMYSSIPTTVTYWNPFNSFSSNMQYANKIWICTGQQTKLFVYTSHSDRVGENVVVTIRYTKTTS